jgi:hypothetical protein
MTDKPGRGELFLSVDLAPHSRSLFAAKPVPTFADRARLHDQPKWNPLRRKRSCTHKELSTISSEKWFPLFRIMLYEGA